MTRPRSTLGCDRESLPLSARRCRECWMGADGLLGLVSEELRDLSRFAGDWSELRETRLAVLAWVIEDRMRAGRCCRLSGLEE